MTKIDAIVEEILTASVRDWNPVDLLVMYATEFAEPGEDFRDLFRQALERLFFENLAEAGRIGDEYVSEGNSPKVLARVLAECEIVKWDHDMAGYWLLATAKGRQIGVELL